MVDKKEIANEFREIQDEITNTFEGIEEGIEFKEDNWDREEGGGGRTRVLQSGNILEKAGVNFSEVHGPFPEALSKEWNVSKEETFFATGVSIVMHPYNPFVPIIHMNIRYFEMSNGDRWFGGGIDLTPIYIDDHEASFFHNELKKVCDNHDHDHYPAFKKWADDYFFIEHRNETRGIGGIFFDHLRPDENTSLEEHFSFVKDIGRTFAPLYKDLILKKKDHSYGEREKIWRAIRRGRYVEFNLVYDRGTKFGLRSNGRIESILMSLPTNASWYYDYRPEEGSQEEKTLNSLKKGIDWIGEGS